MINLLDSVITGVVLKGISDEDAICEYMKTQNVSYFNLLYDRYSRKVYAKCYTILKDDMKAEDATQDIFMKLLVSLSKFEGKAKFSTWLYTITYNFCIDIVRKESKDKTVQVDGFDRLGETIEDEVDDALLLEIAVERLKYVLDDINADDKAILLMKYQDDLSIKDICEVLSKSESAIKMQIKRAKEKCLKVYRQKYKYLEN